MKKYLLFIAGFILLFNSGAVAQFKAPTYTEIQHFTHDMRADSTDSWSYSGGLFYPDANSTPNFDLWIKPHLIDNIHHFFGYQVNGDVLSAQLYNTSELELATTSITRQNANKYQYRVFTDSVELVPWTTPTVFRSNKFTSYTYFGKFDCRRKTVTLIIAEKNNKHNRMVCVYNSDDKRPAQIKRMSVEYPTGLSAKGESDWNRGFTIWSAKEPQSLELEIENTSETEMYHVYLKREYKGKEDIARVGNNWEHKFASPFTSIRISSSFFSRPGKYIIIIRPEMSAGNVPTIIGAETRANFTVAPGPTTVPLKLVIFILLVIIATGLRLYFYLRRKNKIAAQAKEIAVLQLQSVRAQLNPHFIFNALAGIQNLMNKNEVENANKYLARFARLTRNVLDEGQKELTPIADEVSLLTDYLEMEQMRFGFKFSINVGEGVDQQIEIPAMLLQPFAENAVKHGISALKDEGFITVNISQTGKDIILKVTDNGGGFTNTQAPGMGIKLCEERIKLLNSIYKNSTILLHINPTDKGTTVTIELKNWL